MKAVICCLVAVCSVFAVSADTLLFEGSSTQDTLGEYFESADTHNTWSSTNLTSLGVTVWARTDNANHRLNANSDEFGIDSDIVGETASDFDVGETMVLKFSERVSLDLIDFNSFESGDVFIVAVSNRPFFRINYSDLDSGTTDDISLTPNIVVEKDTEVSFFTEAGSIGLDSMNITVIPEPTVLSLIGLFGVGTIVTRRFVQM